MKKRLIKVEQLEDWNDGSKKGDIKKYNLKDALLWEKEGMVKILDKIKEPKKKTIKRKVVKKKQIKEGMNRKQAEEVVRHNKQIKKEKSRPIITQHIKNLLDKRLLWDYILDELDKKHVGDIPAKEIVLLSAIGRLVKNKNPFSFSLILHSESSAGKDHLVESVLKLFPDEDVEAFGRISKTFLTYAHDKRKEPQWTYDGKILYLEEVTEEILNNEIMKVFTAGKTKSGITKDQQSEVIEVRGKPVVICTTATSKPTPEILNRFSIVKLDESEEQTRRTYGHEEEEYDEEIIEFLSNMKSKTVSIPLGMRKKISKGFPANKTSMRRAFPRFLDIIKAIAVFHGNPEIEWEDYDLAVRIFSNYRSGVASIPLKQSDKLIVSLLEESEEALSAVEISANMKGYLSRMSVYNHLNNLENNEILQSFDLRDNFNNPVKKYKISEEFKDKNPIQLPPSGELI